jgi:hypothetical protein
VRKLAGNYTNNGIDRSSLVIRQTRGLRAGHIPYVAVCERHVTADEKRQ